MESRWPAPLVGDLDGDFCLRDRHIYEDGQRRPVVVAVFHGVQCRLCYGGLEPPQGPLRQTQPTHRPGHLLRRPALVAGLAGYAQLGERTAGAAAGCRHSSSDLSRVTRVMSSSCSQSSPVKRLSSESRNPISDDPPPRWVPTIPCSLGKPNISRWGSCASDRKSVV